MVSAVDQEQILSLAIHPVIICEPMLLPIRQHIYQNLTMMRLLPQDLHVELVNVILLVPSSQ